MSGENVEVVQAAFDAYLRGDEPTMFRLVARDVVVTQFPDQVDVRDYHGHEGVAAVMADWIGTWEDWSIELLRARDLGEIVLVAARQRGRGRASGVPMEEEVAFAFSVRDGQIARWQMFRSEQQALEAMGLAKQSAPEENVALVWRMIEHWNAREDALDLVDPEIELQTPFSLLTGEAYRGIAGYLQWRADVTEQFEQWHMNIDEVIPVGESRVLAVGYAQVRGHGSGIEFDQPAAGVVDFRAGRVLRVRIFLSEAEAWAAAGVE